MARLSPAQVETFFDSFAEAMSRLLAEAYHKHFAELDLTVAQAQVLRVLRPGPVPTGRLAAELRISAPAVTQLTNRLTAKRLIERQTAADDRRLVLVALSAKGRRLVDQFRAGRSRILLDALGELSDAERGQVAEAFGKVTAALENYGAPGAGRTAGKGARRGAGRAARQDIKPRGIK